MSEDPRVSRATLTSQVEDAIRLDIVGGVLAPGQRLRFGDLSQAYGVSATPLREALQRLAAENLIDWDPRLGATVAPLSEKELRDIYRLRDILEPLALESSIEHGTDAWMRQVDRAWQRYDATSPPDKDSTRDEASAWSQVHRAFHEALFASCDSPWLLRFIAALSEHSERYRALSARTSTHDTHAEHADLYRATAARDTDAAVAALRRHLAATVTAVEHAMTTQVEPTETLLAGG